MNLIDLQISYRVTNEQLATATGRTLDDIYAWQTGVNEVPAYIELTMDAVSRRLRPASVEQMHATRDLSMMLGIPHRRVEYWQRSRQYPMAARLAVAALTDKAGRISSYDREILNRVNRGRYFRVTGGWRSRPVMGKMLPTIQKRTAEKFIDRDLLQVIHGNELKLTDKGKAAVYG